MSKLKDETIRNRKFLLGTVTRVLRFFSVPLSQISLRLDSIKEFLDKTGNQTFSVKVENQKNFKTEINRALALLKKINEKDKIDVETTIDLSKVVSGLTEVKKSVSSLKFPKPHDPTKETKRIVEHLINIQNEIASIPQPKEAKFPKSISMPESKQILTQLKGVQKAILSLSLGKPPRADFKPILEGLKSLEKVVKTIPKPKDVVFPTSIEVGNFPPQMVPQPVTNININPLRGIVHQSTTTATTNLKTLPGYGVLEGRRSIIFYNNSSTITAFIGGSTVTTSNGLPLEPKSFSPSFDSGPLQVWYGITSSGTADIRTIEIQNDSGQ